MLNILQQDVFNLHNSLLQPSDSGYIHMPAQ